MVNAWAAPRGTERKKKMVITPGFLIMQVFFYLAWRLSELWMEAPNSLKALSQPWEEAREARATDGCAEQPPPRADPACRVDLDCRSGRVQHTHLVLLREHPVRTRTDVREGVPLLGPTSAPPCDTGVRPCLQQIPATLLPSPHPTYPLLWAPQHHSTTLTPISPREPPRPSPSLSSGHAAVDNTTKCCMVEASPCPCGAQ